MVRRRSFKTCPAPWRQLCRLWRLSTRRSLRLPVPPAVEDVAVPAAPLAAAPDLSAVLTLDASDYAATAAALR